MSQQVHFLKVYKIEKEVVALDREGLEILERDASGWWTIHPSRDFEA
jgi:hypothetical protein